jgi:hypothetical protein
MKRRSHPTLSGLFGRSADKWRAAWKRDGSFITYSSNESGPVQSKADSLTLAMYWPEEVGRPMDNGEWTMEN